MYQRSEEYVYVVHTLSGYIYVVPRHYLLVSNTYVCMVFEARCILTDPKLE